MVETDARDQLLEAVVGYFVTHGVANFTLRSLAAEIDTSHQLLMYHFGSRENLTRAALSHIQAAIITDLDDYLARNPRARDPVHIWRHLTKPGGNRLSVEFQCLGLALIDPEQYGEYAAEVVRVWRTFTERLLAEQGMQGRAKQTAATVLVGAVRGLALDLIATDDRRRVNAAIKEIQLLYEAFLDRAG